MMIYSSSLTVPNSYIYLVTLDLKVPTFVLELPMYSTVGCPKSIHGFVNETELKLYDILTPGIGNPKKYVE